MELSGNSKELALLKTFSPLDAMRPENLLTLARRMRRLQAPRGRLLFTEGDEEKHTFYLLSGTIDLMSEGEVVGTVRSGTPKSKNPLAHALPRPYSAVVTSDRHRQRVSRCRRDLGPDGQLQSLRTARDRGRESAGAG
jgi:hypothetical protein